MPATVTVLRPSNGASSNFSAHLSAVVTPLSHSAVFNSLPRSLREIGTDVFQDPAMQELPLRALWALSIPRVSKMLATPIDEDRERLRVYAALSLAAAHVIERLRAADYDDLAAALEVIAPPKTHEEVLHLHDTVLTVNQALLRENSDTSCALALEIFEAVGSTFCVLGLLGTVDDGELAVRVARSLPLPPATSTEQRRCALLRILDVYIAAGT